MSEGGEKEKKKRVENFEEEKVKKKSLYLSQRLPREALERLPLAVGRVPQKACELERGDVDGLFVLLFCPSSRRAPSPLLLRRRRAAASAAVSPAVIAAAAVVAAAASVVAAAAAVVAAVAAPPPEAAPAPALSFSSSS